MTKADEPRDRRRVGRALDDAELARLLDVAGSRGRRAWYLPAALAGLRKGDLRRLTWVDIDFDAGVIDVRGGKSGRDDTVPLHPDLAAELLPMRGMPKARVFPTVVTDRTRLNDFLAAGLAERVTVLDGAGKPLLKRWGRGRGLRMVPVTKIRTRRAAWSICTRCGPPLAQTWLAPASRPRWLARSCGTATIARR